ncbi:hypothetical protein ACFQX7_20790 [Luedemannella flava]
MFGLVYLIGAIAVLAVAAAATARADHAARLRFPATGAGLGLVALLVAMVVRASVGSLGNARSIIDNMASYITVDANGAPLSPSEPSGFTSSVGPGLMVAFAAVLLPLGAVWLASRAARPGSTPRRRRPPRPTRTRSRRAGTTSSRPVTRPCGGPATPTTSPSRRADPAGILT